MPESFHNDRPEGGSTCRNGRQSPVGQDTRILLWPKDISMGHHAGISFEGWVNITGMVGQHKTEWWVNMLRNLQVYNGKIFVSGPLLIYLF